MKYISVFLLLIFFSTMAEAVYLRSITIGSFSTQKDKEEVLKDIKIFLQEHDELQKIQKIDKFEFSIRTKNNYHTLVAQPFIDKKRVQKALDIFRSKYTGAYPKSIKPNEIKVQKKEANKEPIEFNNVKLRQAEVQIKEQEVKIEPLKVQSTELEKSLQLRVQRLEEINNGYKEQAALALEVEQLKILEQKKNVVKEESKEVSFEEEYLWQILFAIASLFFLITLVLFIRLKYKIEEYINKIMISEEMIEQLNTEIKSKEVLISHVSHELRTPITAIIGLTHIVLEGTLCKVQKNNVLRIDSSSQHLLSIINDILDVSKIKAGKLSIEKSEFNINQVFDYSLNIISIQAKKNNVGLSLNVDKDIPSHIIGDSLRLGQVLINLLGNAVKFTKDGEITLGVKKLSTYNDSVKLAFSISDTGIGMTPTQIENVFNSYSQAEGSTSREFGGTGLGLSISKQLVEMMNGEIKVQSKKGVGTIFTFSILFKLKDAQNVRQYRLPSSSMLDKRILIIDSVNKNIITLKKSLEYFNYKTHSIPSFEEAVIEPDMEFDIVILNEDKLSVLTVDKIREMQKSLKVKLVIMSDIHNNLENEFLKNLEVDAYLRIPFTQQSMLDLVIELYAVKSNENRSKKLTLKDRLKELSGKKVLVAEDNELNHKVISGLLLKSGIELTYVLNGQEAVDLIRKDIKFDMILMDINMPIMNGYDASLEIRKDAKYDYIPILALTADVMDESIRKALDSGMQGHISKPIVVDTFYKKLLEILEEPVALERDVSKIKKAFNAKSDEYEELSVSSGLAGCKRDEELYKSILEDFKVIYLDSSEKLENFCTEGNFKEARNMAMDIKDVALNIGAYNLCEVTANLEYEFEKGTRSNYSPLISAYKISLDKLYINIDSYLEKV